MLRCRRVTKQGKKMSNREWIDYGKVSGLGDIVHTVERDHSKDEMCVDVIGSDVMLDKNKDVYVIITRIVHAHTSSDTTWETEISIHDKRLG